MYDITLMDWATRKVTPLTHENTKNHLWQSVAWSPDGKTLYANRLEVSFTDADIYAIDVAGPLWRFSRRSIAHSHPNYALLFGGIRTQRLKVVVSSRLVDTEQSLGVIWWLTP